MNKLIQYEVYCDKSLSPNQSHMLKGRKGVFQTVESITISIGRQLPLPSRLLHSNLWWLISVGLLQKFLHSRFKIQDLFSLKTYTTEYIPLIFGERGYENFLKRNGGMKIRWKIENLLLPPTRDKKWQPLKPSKPPFTLGWVWNIFILERRT